ncbi:hypothetical protein GMA92_06210 [Turicibacter sanguinis]|uniref:Lipoprotein n=1 Tax=Turicibacter sanguinis TaxID=154288 RepID=A0A9X4XCS9_9FIRM|nr:hypothetical protein [uncultured Turicibacter sp.]MTK21008.1 hypothetical protein [Turicibacter sanguinis]MTK73210.1 hypothetical protein [Turicibacter sanguinis]
MKKLAFICLFIMSILSLSACSNLSDTKMGIGPYPLNERDQSLLESFALLDQSQLLSFNAPKEATSLMIHLYSLDESGNWQDVQSGGGISIETERDANTHLEGTFAMTLNDDHSINFVISSHGRFSSRVDLDDLGFDSAISTHSFLTDFQTIELNKEIPVAIIVFDNGTSMRSFSVDSYFEPDIFEGMNSVQAVTLTFTNKEL